MKILVTGGAGFIGSHLCERLLKDGHDVTILDNLSSGSREHIDIGKSSWAIEGDISNLKHGAQDALDLEWTNPDRIYHLACPASPVAYQKDPVQTMMTNVVGTKNVLELARKKDARILLTSTSEVYGNPLEHPQTEEYSGNVNCTGPRACYDEGKRSAESLMYDYQRMYGVDVRVARIFNTYGPRMQSDDGRVVSNFITQALRDEPLTLYGGGAQTRSFCYVSDMVEGLIRLMESDYTQPMNLGNPEEVRIGSLARTVIHKVGQGTLGDCPMPEDDPVKRKPDISKAKEILGWEPKVSLDEGLDRTIGYFEEIKIKQMEAV